MANRIVQSEYPKRSNWLLKQLLLSIGMLERLRLICFSRYFSLQATNPLGFDDAVRMEIESNICREGGPLPDCFTTPLRQAWTTMEKVSPLHTRAPSFTFFESALHSSRITLHRGKEQESPLSSDVVFCLSYCFDLDCTSPRGRFDPPLQAP